METKHPSESVFGIGVFVAAAYLFVKTAHVMSYFAPSTISQLLGLDVSFYFGLGAAGLVEVIAIAFHYWPRTRHTLVGRLGMWSLLIISGLCQIVDGYLVQGSEATMGPGLKAFLEFGVPLVPLYALVLLFAVGAGVDEEASGRVRQPSQWTGLVPLGKKLMYGAATRTVDQPIPAGPPFKQPEPAKPTNPTNGRQTPG